MGGKLSTLRRLWPLPVLLAIAVILLLVTLDQRGVLGRGGGEALRVIDFIGPDDIEHEEFIIMNWLQEEPSESEISKFTWASRLESERIGAGREREPMQTPVPTIPPGDDPPIDLEEEPTPRPRDDRPIDLEEDQEPTPEPEPEDDPPVEVVTQPPAEPTPQATLAPNPGRNGSRPRTYLPYWKKRGKKKPVTNIITLPQSKLAKKKKKKSSPIRTIKKPILKGKKPLLGGSPFKKGNTKKKQD